VLAVARRARVGGHDAVEGVVPHAHALQPQPDHVPLHTRIDGRRYSVSGQARARRSFACGRAQRCLGSKQRWSRQPRGGGCRRAAPGCRGTPDAAGQSRQFPAAPRCSATGSRGGSSPERPVDAGLLEESGDPRTSE
jgi:hypothetical protein